MRLRFFVPLLLLILLAACNTAPAVTPTPIPSVTPEPSPTLVIVTLPAPEDLDNLVFTPTDYMLGVVGTHKIDSTTMHVCASYWMNGAKASGGDSPDLLVGLASVEMELDEDWALLWEYKGVFGIEHSEFTRTYICPGISWSGSNTTIGFSGLVSAVREGAGLDFDWAPYFRVYYRFF